MQICLYADCSDLEDEIIESLSSSLDPWVSEEKALEKHVCPSSGLTIGVRLQIRKGRELKNVINHLYRLAKETQSEFVVGLYNEGTQSIDEICYFGHEEGRPDLYEISSYIGVKV